MIRFVHLATAARLFARMSAVHRIVFGFFLFKFFITIFRCFTCFTWARATTRCALRTIHSLYKKRVPVHDTYTSRVPLIVTIFVHNFAQRLWILIFRHRTLCMQLLFYCCRCCFACATLMTATIDLECVHTMGPAGAGCKQWRTNWKILEISYAQLEWN